MQKVLSPEMVVELRRRHFRKKMSEVYWLAAIALIIFAIAALVVPYLQKMSHEEDALESFVQDITRIYHKDGVNGVRALCGARMMEEVGLNYRCRIGANKITIAQFYGGMKLRTKYIPRVARLEETSRKETAL